MVKKTKRGRGRPAYPPASKKSEVVTAKFKPAIFAEMDVARQKAGMTWADFIESAYRALKGRTL